MQTHARIKRGCAGQALRAQPRLAQPAKLLTLAAFLGLGLAASFGATLVNLDATGQPLGPLATWPNTGTFAGDFNAPFEVPEVIKADGVKGVSFQSGSVGLAGTSYNGPEAPASICGDASRTIEAWVWDPAAQDEKGVFSWGHRDGPDFSNCSFGHGVHPTWGCLGGWGGGDFGYIPTNVVFKRWTYVVFTYDSATMTAKVYKDGALDNTKVYTAPLNTWAVDGSGVAIPFRVARQTDAVGSASSAGIGTNIVAKIRVQDIALTAAAVQAQYDAEKAQFGLVDTDGDGMPDWWEIRYGLNPNDPSDAANDLDNDGATNLKEYQMGTDPTNPDTDGDGLKDGVETKTGVWVSANDTGTDPLKADTDGDGLSDGVETNTGVFVNANNTGTNPNKKDTDGDTWDDAGEILLGSNPNDPKSMPTAASWGDAVTRSNPKYWYRFEETDPSQAATNSGSAQDFQGAYGSGIVAANLGKASALPSLGKAIEFTGPAAPNTTGKYVDMAAAFPADMTAASIPELVNLRPPTVDKTTTVEYWFKTTQKGTHGANSWQSPSIMAHESPGDGDMYWGKINDQGEFGFSTSDLNDVLTKRDLNKNVTDGQWHHMVMIKQWHVSQPCVSTMYIDGGPLQPGGSSFTKTTAAGNVSYQDSDSLIHYLGFTQNGELENVQYIGMLDEVAIYDRALTDAEVRLHSKAVLEADTDGDGMPDVWEINNGFNPNDPSDASQDADNDGSTNLQEFKNGTNPRNPDTDGDGLKDGAETNTGIWVSATNTGTDPLNPDTDGDGLLDGVETNTGTSPLKRDTDGDGFSDQDEILIGTNPTDATSHPVVPATYAAAVQADKPIHWLRFEEATIANGVTNQGSAAPQFTVIFGPGILDADLGKASANAKLGKALEFTGPAAGTLTDKYVDFGQPIPELINLRQDASGATVDIEEGKATTVEYWFKTTIKGLNGNDTWRNPSILAHESPDDGDMYWGNFNQDGDFIFSTSDWHDAHVTNNYATDGKWHHVVMSKIWHTNSPCVSRLYMDGGALYGGQTIETTTTAGFASGQDNDSVLQYLGFTQFGDAANAQFIGMIDEVAIYTNAFTEAQARVHYVAGGGQPPVPPSVTLQGQKSGSNVILTWPQGTLQSADVVNGTYTPVTGATSPYTNAVTGDKKFFRVLVQ